MSNKDKVIAGVLAVLVLSGVYNVALDDSSPVMLNKQLGEKITEIDLTFKVSPANTKELVILSNSSIKQISLNGEDISSYVCSLTLRNVTPDKIEYGTDKEMFNLSPMKYKELLDKFGVGADVYILPPIQGKGIIAENFKLDINVKNNGNFEVYSKGKNGYERVN